MTAPTASATPFSLPVQCPPDPHLTREHLEALFNDFNTSTSASIPTATTFANLVNGVRQAYMSNLLGQQMELKSQSEQSAQLISEIKADYEQQLSQINAERKVEQDMLLRCITDASAAAAAGYNTQFDTASATSTGNQAYSDTGNITTIYVGTAGSPDRDTVGWAPQDKFGWTPKFQFNVFRTSEVFTTKIRVGCSGEPDRISIRLDNATFASQFTEVFQFYVFEKQRPGTEMISVYDSHKDGLYRCILARGASQNSADGWKLKFVFWVPV